VIRRRTILGGLLALTLVATGWYVALRVADQVEHEAVQAGQIYAEHSATVAQKVAEDLERQLRELKALAERWLVNQSDTQLPVRVELARAMVRQLRHPGSYVSHYVINDRAGRVVWQSGGNLSTPEDALASALPPLRGLRNPASDSWLVAIISHDNSGEAGIYASVRLAEDSGEFGGVAVAVLRSSALSFELARVRSFEGFVLALILDTGQLIARSETGPLRIGFPVGGLAVTERL
jgi:hypothetical protein